MWFILIIAQLHEKRNQIFAHFVNYFEDRTAPVEQVEHGVTDVPPIF